MEPFNKCPRCGEVDVRRTRCACGYGSGATAPAAKASSDDEERSSADRPLLAEGGSGLRERLIGLVLLLLGAGMSYLCIYNPLAAAHRGEESVSLSLKGAILCPIAVIMGAAYLILGARATTVFGTRERPTAATWVCCILLLLAGLGLYFYLRSVMESLGYQF